MQPWVRPLILACLLGGPAGCASRAPTASNPFEIDSREYDRIYQASIEVLRDHGFRVDRHDYRFGRITTRPIASPTIFEPWAGHNSTLQQAGASTVASQRRVITIQLDPMAGDALLESAAYSLEVKVQLQRVVMPLRRLDGTVGQNVLRALDDVPVELQKRSIPSQYWEPLGRDELLEQRLLRQIVQRAMRIPTP